MESQGCPDAALKPDYVDGFRDGFVEYVFAGGTGEPPPVPPRIYWNVWLRDAAGKQRAANWFDGWRHGARVAREGGYRAIAVVQSSVLAEPRDIPPSAFQTDAAKHGESPDSDWQRNGETLPQPQQQTTGTQPANPFSNANTASVAPDLPLPDGESKNDATNEQAPSAIEKTTSPKESPPTTEKPTPLKPANPPDSVPAARAPQNPSAPAASKSNDEAKSKTGSATKLGVSAGEPFCDNNPATPKTTADTRTDDRINVMAEASLPMLELTPRVDAVRSVLFQK